MNAVKLGFVLVLQSLFSSPGTGAEVVEDSVDSAFLGPVVPIPQSLSPSEASIAAASGDREGEEPETSVALPDSAGRIEVRFGRSRTPPQMENPFDCRVRPSKRSQTLLRLGCLSVGSKSHATINGRVLSVGDRIEGFMLVVIDSGGVIVERAGARMLLPPGRTVTITEEGDAGI